MRAESYYMTLPKYIGDTIKFHMDDDGKKHTGKISRIHVDITPDGVDVEYEVKIKFKGVKTHALVKPKDILK